MQLKPVSFPTSFKFINHCYITFPSDPPVGDAEILDFPVDNKMYPERAVRDRGDDRRGRTERSCDRTE